MSKPEIILEKLPKKTPSWAVGFTTIIVALFSSVITLFLVSKTEINQAIGWAEKHHEVEAQAKIAENGLVIDNVMKLLNIKSEQILELSKAVSSTQQNNFVLMQRIDALEITIAEVKKNLDNCYAKLRFCEDNQK